MHHWQQKHLLSYNDLLFYQCVNLGKTTLQSPVNMGPIRTHGLLYAQLASVFSNPIFFHQVHVPIMLPRRHFLAYMQMLEMSVGGDPVLLIRCSHIHITPGPCRRPKQHSTAMSQLL